MVTTCFLPSIFTRWSCKIGGGAEVTITSWTLLTESEFVIPMSYKVWKRQYLPLRYCLSEWSENTSAAVRGYSESSAVQHCRTVHFQRYLMNIADKLWNLLRECWLLQNFDNNVNSFYLIILKSFSPPLFVIRPYLFSAFLLHTPDGGEWCDLIRLRIIIINLTRTLL